VVPSSDGVVAVEAQRLHEIKLAEQEFFGTRGHTVPLRAGIRFVLAHPATEVNDGNNRQGEDQDREERQHCVLSLIGL
jgi:hypothetical protein